MNINFKPSQLELFPGTTGDSADAGRPRYLFAHLTLSFENIVVTAIIILITLVVAFSLGVEKGKKIRPIAISRKSAVETTKNNNQVKNILIANQTNTAVPVETLAIKQNQSPSLKSVNDSVPTIADSNMSSAKSRLFNPFNLAGFGGGKSGTQEITGQSRINVVSNQQDDVRLSSAVQPVKTEPVVNKTTISSPLSNEAEKIYTIQVASFKDQQYAQKEATALIKKGFETSIMTKGDYFIVCVGKFNTKDDVDKALGKLKQKYNDCLIRRL